MLISLIGALTIVISNNWMVMFIGMQCMSLPIFGLLAHDRDNTAAMTSAVRYLILSGIAMAFLLFGMVLVYASLGTMDFHLESQKLLNNALPFEMVFFGFSLVLVGIGFKASLVLFISGLQMCTKEPRFMWLVTSSLF